MTLEKEILEELKIECVDRTNDYRDRHTDVTLLKAIQLTHQKVAKAIFDDIDNLPVICYKDPFKKKSKEIVFTTSFRIGLDKLKKKWVKDE
jgi:hypothetical protein